MILSQLIANSKRVFPNTYMLASSLASDVTLVGSNFYKKAKQLLIQARVPGSKGSYKIFIRFDSITDPTNVIDSSKTHVKIKCNCAAFKYFVQFPNYSVKGLEGKPTKWAKVPAVVRNPKNIPAPCKHILAVFIALAQEKKLK